MGAAWCLVIIVATFVSGSTPPRTRADNVCTSKVDLDALIIEATLWLKVNVQKNNISSDFSLSDRVVPAWAGGQEGRNSEGSLLKSKPTDSPIPNFIVPTPDFCWIDFWYTK